MSDLSSLLQDQLPLTMAPFDPGSARTGLVLVDLVNGFATPGCGPLAPPAPDGRIDQMIAWGDRLARHFLDQDLPVLAFRDSHPPDKPEAPYPPHCLQGSGHDDLVPALTWLTDRATIIPKDCINGWIGADRPGQPNQVAQWAKRHQLARLLVMGICTDICVMDFVLTALSARNHGLLDPVREIWVFEPGCATYDLPLTVARQLGLPDATAHPRSATHHMGLYFMASRGAQLASHMV